MNADNLNILRTSAENHASWIRDENWGGTIYFSKIL